MTNTSLQATLEEDYETELSRLGSSKAIYALTDGEMETEVVLDALAARASTAAETFSGWTDDDEYGDLFRTAAEVSREHAQRVAGAADAADATQATDSLAEVDEALRGLEDSDARLGGLLAWALVTDRTLSQAVGFFVGNADPQAADLFRDLRSDVDGLREETLDRLTHVDDADRDVALEASEDVVEAAYEHYVETLEGMGVKVKPVC